MVFIIRNAKLGKIGQGCLIKDDELDFQFKKSNDTSENTALKDISSSMCLVCILRISSREREIVLKLYTYMIGFT
ncbi:hypothetical protein MTR_3g027100 [Medicago truncatula]|uniref:Uncharacterized protein n=1 Tax=Medicago truncatula TaxID=3880 RepID=G7J1S7_MEDTR|nr:hypothetical protein MTR_3g027100 [Medicago truncatula]